MSTQRRRQAEKNVFQFVWNMFERWLPRVNMAVLRNFRQFGTFPEPLGVYETTLRWEMELEGLQENLTRAASVGWSVAFDRPTFSSNSFHVLNALQTSRNLLVDVPNQTHTMIIDEILQATSAGVGLEETVQRVNRLLSITGVDTWRNRAEFIATTETTRAFNAGALAAAEAAQPSLGTLLKQWNDQDDASVRASHRTLDGQQLPLKQPFQLPGATLLYPGDPSGAADEVINCRCDLSFRRAEV